MFAAFSLTLVFLTFAVLLSATPAIAQAVNESFKLLASDPAAGDAFGRSVAVDGDLIAVGANFDDGHGSVTLFSATSGVQLARLQPADGADGDEFGFSVAIDGDLVVVGARRAAAGGADSGAAYIFDAASGDQLIRLLPDDGSAGDEFGHAVAIADGIVVVGAKRDDVVGNDSGSAYLFDAATGDQLHKLLPADGATNDNFGGAVAIAGGIVAIGAHADWDNGPLSGSAYLFDAATGDQLHKLLAANGATSDFFGAALDIDDGLVVVGAWARSVVFDHSGAAYVFDAATGSQLAYLVPDDAHDRDNFGISVAISGGVIAVGAHKDGNNGFDAGSVYLFDASSGSFRDLLLSSDGAAFDYFGGSVACDGGTIAVGAAGDADGGEDSGSAYVFGAGQMTAVGDGPPLAAMTLLPAQPNPFNPRTTLHFELRESGHARLQIFAMTGRRVATLVDGHRPAGAHTAAWAGLDDRGRALPSGVYMARLEGIGAISTTKLVLTK